MKTKQWMKSFLIWTILLCNFPSDIFANYWGVKTLDVGQRITLNVSDATKSTLSRSITTIKRYDWVSSDNTCVRVISQEWWCCTIEALKPCSYIAVTFTCTYMVSGSSLEEKMSHYYDICVKENEIQPTAITIPSSLDLKIGGSSTLTPTLTPSNAKSTITWSSDNTSVATVSSGTVTAIGAGTAHITATTANGKSARCDVTVEPIKPVLSLPSEALVAPGNSITLTPSLTPPDASVTYTWTSDNPSVAIVDSKGVVLGRNLGTANITVTSSTELSASCKVTVGYPQAEKIELPETAEIFVDEKLTLTPIITPSDACPTLTWESMNPEIATVSENGTVIGVSDGTTYIIVSTENGRSAMCKVTVKFTAFVDGEIFTALTEEGVEMTFKVISANDRTCQVGTGNDKKEGRAILVSVTGELTVPSSVRGYKVTDIGKYAFFNCSGLTSITIPEGITSIGNYAFSGCSSLTSAIIPEGITSIGDYAFSDCRGLTSITIPESVISIGWSAFKGCSGLSTITIPEGVTSIGNYAFNGCSGLLSVTIKSPTFGSWFAGLTSIKKVTLGEGVTSICDYAFNNCSGLTSVSIPNSVTSIGNYAFSGCSCLTSIIIPEGVTSIGNSAFSSCNSLTSVVVEEGNTVYDSRNGCNAIIKTMSNALITGCKNTIIPYNVTSIDNSAFSGCSGLTSIIIPESVTSIGKYAFNNCSGLTSITIPESATSIGDNAFYGCSSLTSITIPEAVTSIGSSAFSGCSGLTSVTINSNSIVSKTYTWSSSIKDIFGTQVAKYILGDNITCIGNYAFSGCSGLTSITIPESVTNIGIYAFSDCKNLTSITIPEGVTSIGNSAFSGCSGLTSIIIPESVASIGDYAFSSCSGLTSITIPEGVTSIGNSAFSDCSNLIKVVVPNISAWCKIPFSDSTQNPLSYAHHLYSGEETEITDLVIPEGVTSIGDLAFIDCSDLTSVTIPESVISIGEGAFLRCSSLTSVSIPESVTSIGYSAFLGCSSLTSITIPKSVTSIDGWAFGWCSGLTSIIIPESVTSIGEGVFLNCSSLTSIIIPNSVTSIGDNSFSGCNSLKDVYCHATAIPDAGSSIFSSTPIDEATLHVPATSLDAYKSTEPWRNFSKIIPLDDNPNDNPDDNPDDDSTIIKFADAIVRALCVENWDANGNGELNENEAATVTSLGNVFSGTDITSFNELAYFTSISSLDCIDSWQGAFLGCKKLTSITIPNSVTSIGNDAFSRCSSLTSITIPESVISIGDDAFFWCCSLTSITIPEGVTSIGDEAFYGCSSLTSITIPKSVTSIGYEVFYGCSSLTSITIPEGVTSIGDEAFYGCSSLTSITIPESVTSIGDEAFYGCRGMSSITIPKRVTTIGKSAFLHCSGLTSIVVEEGNTVYDSRNGCNAIIETASNTLIAGCNNTIIPKGIASINGTAFRGCSGLTSITIPESVTSIGYSAFSGCSSLTSIVVEEGNTIYDSRNDCNAIIETASNTLVIGCKNTIIPKDIASIGGGAFNACSGLISITIPESVTSIGGAAFYGCNGLTSITLPEGITEIGHFAFWGCSGLTSITIPKSVTWIDDCTFSGCSGLTSIYIPDKVSELGYAAFYGCSGLTSVIIGSGVTYIGGEAFSGCTGLKDVYCFAEEIPLDEEETCFVDEDADDPDQQTPIGSATLHVPAVSIDAYKSTKPWKNFGTIVALTDEDVGIKQIDNGQLAKDNAPETIYDLSGHRFSTLQRGINILRMSDGTTKKVLIK